MTTIPASAHRTAAAWARRPSNGPTLPTEITAEANVPLQLWVAEAEQRLPKVHLGRTPRHSYKQMQLQHRLFALGLEKVDLARVYGEHALKGSSEHAPSHGKLEDQGRSPAGSTAASRRQIPAAGHGRTRRSAGTCLCHRRLSRQGGVGPRVGDRQFFSICGRLLAHSQSLLSISGATRSRYSSRWRSM